MTPDRPEQDSRPGADGPRIAYVLDEFPVLSQTFVSEEVRALRSGGARVSVLTHRDPLRRWSAGAELDAEHGVRVRQSVLGAHLYWVRHALGRYLRYLGVVATAPLLDKPFLLRAPAVAREVRREGAAHLHTHFAFRAASSTRAVAALTGLPWSVTTHANDLFTQERQLPARLDGARVLTISAFNQDYLRARGIDSDVNYCGVDVDLLAGQARDGTPIDVLFVGRFVEKKGPLELVRAVALLHAQGAAPGRVVMAGEGPLLAACVETAGRHGLGIEFPGAVDHDDVLALLSAARVFCLPCQQASDGDMDGIPVALMEAMALGALVVTRGISGIPELVNDGCGWLLPPSGDPDDDVAALAATLQHVLSVEPDAADEVRSAARARVEGTFTLAAQAAGVRRLVRS